MEPDLTVQYDRCFNALKDAGMMEMLPIAGTWGIVGIDGHEYPIPAYSQILAIMTEKEPLVTTKIAQGFTKLQLTPVALSLNSFQRNIADQIRKHFVEKKLFYTNTNHLITELVQYEPLWLWDGWLGGELAGQTYYYPETYGENHSGVTKQALLEKIKNTTSCPGWAPLLVEDVPFLHQAGTGKTLSGRKQLENNKRPVDYLATLQQAPYQYESGLTIEDWLTLFAERLETTDQVSNDWDDSNAMWLLGNYREDVGMVPRGHWGRDIRKGHIDRDIFRQRREIWGVATTVRIAEMVNRF